MSRLVVRVSGQREPIADAIRRAALDRLMADHWLRAAQVVDFSSWPLAAVLGGSK